jgi:hypothetical protein
MFLISKCFINNCDKKNIIVDRKISFGWQLKSDKNNTVQIAYEVVVLNDKKEPIWHTGNIESSQSLNIYYVGVKLESKKEYFWQVTARNNLGESTESALVSFEMGLINAEDWKAKWIEASMPIKSVKENFNPAEIFSYHPDSKEIENIPLDPPVVFIKDFTIEKKEIKKARLYITAHGVYEAELNGDKVGDEYLAPGFTSYPKMQCYQTHNITAQINQGKNAMKITVADGWYKGKIGLAGIGHQFGNNVALLAQIEVEYADGNFFFNLIGQNKYQTNTYILKGGEEEAFIPKFTYHGFRYVKVTGYPCEINKDSFTAYVLSSDCERAGRITTSNTKINQLLENIYHSQESNFISVPTDCPQREKGGWTGDAQIYTPTAIFNMKIHNFMSRWLENMRLDQYENGQIPNLIPWIESDKMLSCGFGNISAAGWADACIIIPWHLYVQYEDVSFLKDNYDMMKRWLNYVEERCSSNTADESKEYEKYIWDMDFHYGDWFTPSLVNEDGSPSPMISAKLTGNQVATMYFAYSSELLSNIAKILGEKDDEAYYLDLSQKVKAAFNQVYVDGEGKIQNDLQGLYALAAHFNMGSDNTNREFVHRLAEKIKENGNRLDTGFLGTPILLDVLTNYGKKDLAYKLLLQEKCPSWLYMVNRGSTTIWESWDAIRPDGTRNITSYNHYSLGSVQDYIVRRIIGLTKSSVESGRFVVEPDFKAPFEYCSIAYESPYGKIEVAWDLSEGKQVVNITVPSGVIVTLRLPSQRERELGSGTYNINI